MMTGRPANVNEKAHIRVLVADDHAMVREGIVAILASSGDIDVVAQAGDGAEAARKAAEVRPDIAVLDVSMPRLNGLEAARRIRETVPETRILILTMHDEEEYVVKTVRAGASGYLVKDSAASQLIAGIRALRAGKSYFGERARAALSSAADNRAEEPYERLTAREREVFQLVVEGQTNFEISRVLAISPKTVDNHRTRLMEKLHIHSTAALVRYAATHHLMP